jgi:predicted amidohydrolase YtcJ
MDLIGKPAATEAETLEHFGTAMLDALRVGLTSIHDAATSPNSIAFFRQYVPLQFYLHF